MAVEDAPCLNCLLAPIDLKDQSKGPTNRENSCGVSSSRDHRGVANNARIFSPASTPPHPETDSWLPSLVLPRGGIVLARRHNDQAMQKAATC